MSTSPSQPASSRPSVIQLSIKEKAALYAAYIPLFTDGGIFIPSSRDYRIGDDVYVLLSLPDDPQRYPVAGKLAWVTAATIFKDEKKTFTFNQDSYTPGNFGDVFSNKEITLRDALVQSKNVITVDLAMQLNVGKVMNLAAKAGFPKVEKAYPSMALGTAEATPLEVATAYNMFANLGDRVLPTPITQVTQGDGRTVSLPTPDRKNVIRSDVAYVMDDIMKDVINRGTAAQAQGWGFRNNPGKTAFAGKTGTSREGWFAGFTRELVCGVYVGFDNNDDLGLKGSDSAMPVWADFMKVERKRHLRPRALRTCHGRGSSLL